jgi:hypothetical protein
MAVARLVVAALVLGAVACADDAGTRLSTTLALDDIPEAVAAVESALGAGQRYTEINLGSDLVNVFVATSDGQELAYVYSDGVLAPPSAPQAQAGEPFSLDAVDLDVGASLDESLGEQLRSADSELTRLSLLMVDGSPRWVAAISSSRGGVLEVLLAGTGEVLAVVPQ